MLCSYCGEIDNFGFDEDGREYCLFCGHYTGYIEDLYGDDY